MREDLDAGLVKQFPKLFIERHMPMTHTCMCWGFDHGNGWYSIIRNMCGLIQNHIDWTRKNRALALRFNRALRRAIKGNRQDLEYFYAPRDHQTRVKQVGVISEWSRKQMVEEIANEKFRPVPNACSQVIVNQVKEKFGTLRFYYTGGDDYVDGVVRMGEEMTAVTCEDCGAPGRGRHGGWIRTLCDVHAKERDVVDEQAF
jgi:hypothetical protein